MVLGKDIDIAEILRKVKEHGSIQGVANELGIPRTTLRDFIRRETEKLKSYREVDKAIIIQPDKRHVKRFIFSAAQNATKVNEKFLKSLEMYAKYINATLYISGFTYTTSILEQPQEKMDAIYDHSILKYLVSNRIHIGNKLAFCGEMNISPTAVYPLSGLEVYTEDRSGIFPHPKIHLKSIPTANNCDAKLIMTTGCITYPNYIKKKAGIKAEQHHLFGAVIVELLPNGDFFYRHIEAEEDGSFYDLGNYVTQESVKSGIRIGAFVPGDIHIGQENENLIDSVWFHENSLVKDLKPYMQFIHDVSDFTARNHHRINDPHHIFEMYCRDVERVEDEIGRVSDFLEKISSEIKTYVVDSNHDKALVKWLKESDYRSDPPNAIFFLTLQLETYKRIKTGDEDFNIFEWVCRQKNSLKNVRFLKEDDSFVYKDIEFGMHGHHGANGARGNPLAFARMGKKSVTGHTHSIIRIDGHMSAGMFGKLKQNYTHGLSSWSHSCVIVYCNGKRTHVTLRETPNGKYAYSGDNWEKITNE